MLDKLTRIFGEKAGAQSGNDCFKNAVHNAALAIYNGDRPKIFDVNTQNGRHAYLGGGDGSVKSQGLTWKTDYYPELSVEQIKQLGGQDVTFSIFIEALNPENDRYGYHRVLDRLENDYPNIKQKVSNYLRGL